MSASHRTLTSQWPLPPSGVRFLTPQYLTQIMAQHPLSQDLYPVATGYYPDAAGHYMTRQQHDSHLLIYCTDGEGQITALDREYTVSAGQVVSLPAGLAHHYAADQANPWTIYWVHYRGFLAKQFSAFQQPFCPVFSIGLELQLTADFQNLFGLQREVYSRKAGYHSACLLKQMLSLIALLAERQNVSSERKIDLARIQAIMQKHLHAQLDLAALAASAKLSKYHFTRQFKLLTGHSPIQFFIHLKMQHACRLLDIGALSVKQVASACGYSDPYYFSRLFKKTIGRSPSTYREDRLA